MTNKGLNENILNTVEEEKTDEEMQKSTELDIKIDTQLEILESYLAALELHDIQQQKNRDDEKCSISSSRTERLKQNMVRRGGSK